MRSRTWAGRTLAVITLCLTLAGAGCDSELLDLGGISAGGLPVTFMRNLGAILPPDTCAVVWFAWYSRLTPQQIFKACEGASASRSGRNGVDPRARAIGGSGAFVVDTLTIDGTISGSKLPRWTAVMSTPPAAFSAGATSVSASVAVADAEGNVAAAVPAKILATLYDVDRKGKRKKAGKKKAKFDKKTGGADVLFDNLAAARDHYEVDLVVKGRKVTGGNVSYAAANAVQSSARIGPISGRWVEGNNTRAGATPTTTWAGVSVSSVGTTVAAKVPRGTIVVYPPGTSRLGARFAGFDIIALAMQADENVDPPNSQMDKVQFTVYAVNAQGKRSKIATKTELVAKKNGTALSVLEGVAAPASHYEIDAKAIGGKMQDSNLLFSAFVAPAGLAGRVLTAGRLVGARSLPPRVEPARAHSASR